MSEKDINKKAFEQAEEELFKHKVDIVKGYMLETLEKIEQKKKDKETIEEELRVLKLDLEDLRSGDFKKIEERKLKSPTSRRVSVNLVPALIANGSYSFTASTGDMINYTTMWNNATGGTYKTTSKIYYF